MKKSIIVSFTLLLTGIVQPVLGQQDALFTQYIDAQLYSNAAMAGSDDVLSITGIHRQQWAGFTGAPMTTGLLIHSPLHYESIGIGLEVWNDRLGVVNRSTIAGNFAYRFKLKKGGKISFGIKGILDFNSVDISSLSNGENDPRALSMMNAITPNAGVGLLYKSSKWFLGLGAPRLLENSNLDKNGGFRNDIHAYLLTGVILDLKNQWKFRPSAQIRLAQNTPLSADITATLIHKERLYIGLNYRLLASVGAIFQYQISPQFKLGYGFDISQSLSLISSSFGSHEVVLSYDMNFTKESVATPRFF